MVQQLDFGELAEGALIFTAAIAWNTAAKEIIETIYPKKENPREYIKWQFIYAAYVTILVIVIIWIFNFSVEKINNISETLNLQNKTNQEIQMNNNSQQLVRHSTSFRESQTK